MGGAAEGQASDESERYCGSGEEDESEKDEEDQSGSKGKAACEEERHSCEEVTPPEAAEEEDTEAEASLEDTSGERESGVALKREAERGRKERKCTRFIFF